MLRPILGELLNIIWNKRICVPYQRWNKLEVSLNNLYRTGKLRKGIKKLGNESTLIFSLSKVITTTIIIRLDEFFLDDIARYNTRINPLLSSTRWTILRGLHRFNYARKRCAHCLPPHCYLSCRCYQPGDKHPCRPCGTAPDRALLSFRRGCAPPPLRNEHGRLGGKSGGMMMMMRTEDERWRRGGRRVKAATAEESIRNNEDEMGCRALSTLAAALLVGQSVLGSRRNARYVRIFPLSFSLFRRGGGD